MPMRVQCVLFVKSSEDTSASEKYALLPPAYLNHPACAIFTKSNFQIISNSQVKINKNVRFRVIETFLDELKSNVATPPQNICLYFSSFDKDFVQRLFNNCNFKFVTRFRATKVHSVMDEKNVSVIEQFLKAEAIFEYVSDLFTGTLLHFAVDKGYEALLQLLLKHGANISTKTEGYSPEIGGGLTALHVASMRTSLKIVELLLKNGAYLTCRRAAAPLHLAVRYSSLEMVRLFVERGADYEARRHDDFTPLHIAAQANAFQTAEFLLQRGANPNSHIDSTYCLRVKGCTPLHLACMGKRLETAKVLIENGANVNIKCSYYTVLYVAVNYGHIDIIEFILKCQPEVNDEGNQRAFQLAFSKTTRRTKIAVEKMLENGFNIEQRHVYEPDFLFGAIHKNMFEIVEKLLNYGANINEFHSFLSLKLSPLHLAVLHADTRIIQLLLDRGANVDAVRDSYHPKKTPLLDAIEKGDMATFKLLLSYGANVNLDNPNPLISTIERSSKDTCHLQVVELLLENGADVNVVSSEKTPLSTALYERRFELVELLIKFGAKVSFESIQGRWTGNAEALRAFLDYSFIRPKRIDENGVIKTLFDEYDWWSEFRRGLSYMFTTYGECAKILACHILKIEAAHESVDLRPLIPTAVFEFFGLNDYQSQCNAEVSRMKNVKIGRTSVTFFDVLIKSDDISRFSRNEDFVAKFESYDTEGTFPLYGSILKCHFRQGTRRRSLLKMAIKMLKSLFSQFSSLPDEIKEKIVELLNNQDILVLKKCLNMK